MTPVSMVQAISRATTETSTMPLGMEASMLPGHVSSQTSHRTRSSKRTQQSSVTEAILQFGTQMSTNLMTMAEQHGLDAMRREDLLRQEAAEKEKLTAAREKEIQEQNAIREKELQKTALAREQMCKQEKMQLAEQYALREKDLQRTALAREQMQKSKKGV